MRTPRSPVRYRGFLYTIILFSIMIWRFSIIPLILFSVFVNSCRNSANGRKDPPPAESPEPRGQVNGSIHSDSVRIEGNAAVFYKPDSIQWMQIRVLVDTAVFESLQHECFYQQRNARIETSTYYPSVKIIEVNRAAVLLFISKDNTHIVDLNKRQDPCGLFLFNGKNEPRLADLTNIETELGQYFSN